MIKINHRNNGRGSFHSFQTFSLRSVMLVSLFLRAPEGFAHVAPAMNGEALLMINGIEMMLGNTTIVNDYKCLQTKKNRYCQNFVSE